MMMFFTSDTHFGQQRTLELSKRPFSNVREMDEAIIDNWNRVVGPDDTIYHLGDFGDVNIIKSLNGNIILLPGDHETSEDIQTLSKTCRIIQPNTVIQIEGKKLRLVHKPTDALDSDVFILFGHIHKLQMVKKNGLNVGIDCHNFTPISVDEVSFYQNAILHHYDENVFMPKMGFPKD